MVVYPKSLRNISNRQYMYGDFDKDDAKNIDDPKPFNPQVSKYPDHAKDPEYYHKARYGGGEVLLSEELMAIERHNNARAPMLNRFMGENPGSVGRIKTVPSTMKNLRERYLSPRPISDTEKQQGVVGIFDIAGVRILTKNRREANRKANAIKRRYSYDPSQTDDYYKSPKGGVYYAHHVGLVNKRNNNLRLEVQVKSKPMAKLSDMMHTGYKKGTGLNVFRKKARKLFDLGF